VSTGQGVNSALEDVCVLEQQVFDKAAGDLNQALPAFEQQRLPDSAALVKLVQVRLLVPWVFTQQVVHGLIGSLICAGPRRFACSTRFAHVQLPGPVLHPHRCLSVQPYQAVRLAASIQLRAWLEMCFAL
jgi:hypothetical protein